jgi:endogenous inhibitor of DNA gyrase (YacG/DUF329 family)
MRCPICDKEFDRAQSTAAPFCSERCRSIDLGRWLGEIYSLPAEGADSESDAEVKEACKELGARQSADDAE